MVQFLENLYRRSLWSPENRINTGLAPYIQTLLTFESDDIAFHIDAHRCQVLTSPRTEEGANMNSQIRYLAMVSERPDTLARFYSTYFSMRELDRSDAGDIALTD